jgi:putative phosphoesterase
VDDAPDDAEVNLLLLADTHLPTRARDLPAQVWAAVAAADVVVHAGDWVADEAVDALAARMRRGARLVAVAGNNDSPALHERLGLLATAEVAGVRLAVVHETGTAAGRERRCAALFPVADVLVFGHSHIPWDSTATRADGSTLRLLNPGSPTDRRRQPHATYLTARARAGQLHDVVLHRLPQRPPQRPPRRADGP